MSLDQVITYSITLENTNLIFSLDEGKKEIDFFSLDIDGNDYWILKDLDLSNVKVICCEYNHFLNKNEKKTIPYNKNFNFENECFFGASLLAFNDLLLQYLKKEKIFLKAYLMQGIHLNFAQ